MEALVDRGCELELLEEAVKILCWRRSLRLVKQRAEEQRQTDFRWATAKWLRGDRHRKEL